MFWLGIPPWIIFLNSKKQRKGLYRHKLTPQSRENPLPPFIMVKKRKSPNQHGTRSILDIFPARARNAETTVAAQTSADLAPRLDIEPFFSEAAAAAAQDSATKKQPCRSTKTKQPVDYCVSDLKSEARINADTTVAAQTSVDLAPRLDIEPFFSKAAAAAAQDSATKKQSSRDSDEFKLRNNDEEDESIEGEDEEVPYTSNLVDEEAENEEEREKVAEDELCRLEKQLETLAVANFNTCNRFGLNSALEEKDHIVDTFIPFDKTVLLTEAIKLFNALSLEEKERLKRRGHPSQPFYVFAAIDIEREFPGLSTDEIEHLDPDEIIAKVGILVKAWSKIKGDNSVKALCGRQQKYEKWILSGSILSIASSSLTYEVHSVCHKRRN